MRSLPADRWVRRLFWPTILVLLLLAWTNRFIQDDAFISYRYAENLVQNQSITFNLGERVEGYTNFLWTLLMAIPIAIGLDPVVFSQLLGLLFALGTMLATYELAFLVLHERLPAFLGVVLLGANYTFSAYATGGLETQMQACLITAGTLLAMLIVNANSRRSSSLILLSILCALALLTRLDSAIAYAVLFVYVLWHLTWQPVNLRNKAGMVASLLLPVTIVLGMWFVWKFSYYGDLVPNTFYAKAGASTVAVLQQGVLYLFQFVRSYSLLPFVFMGIFLVWDIVSRSGTRLLAVIVLFWLVYVLWVGADFMEFRFMVAVLPLLMVLIMDVISAVNNPRVRAALVMLILVGSLLHAVSFESNQTVESVRGLEEHLTRPEEDWILVGHRLNEMFADQETDVVIATTAAGAIPYYSQLPTVDMLGLNDRWVARNGIVLSPRPGHRRFTTIEYLLEREVNLVIGPPLLRSSQSGVLPKGASGDLERIVLASLQPTQVPDTARLIELPIDEDRVLPVIYLTPHRAVDAFVDEHSIKTYPIPQP